MNDTPRIFVDIHRQPSGHIEVIHFRGKVYSSELRCFQRGVDFQVCTIGIGPRFCWQPVCRLPELVAIGAAMERATNEHPIHEWAVSPDPSASEVSPIVDSYTHIIPKPSDNQPRIT